MDRPSKSLQIVLNWDSNPSVRLFPNSELERLRLWNLKQATSESSPSPLKPVMIWNPGIIKGKEKSHVQIVSNQKDEEPTLVQPMEPICLSVVGWNTPQSD